MSCHLTQVVVMSIPGTDQFFMQLALAEAKRAKGRTSPNPCVGAVIVKNGSVVAAGYHKKAGTPHAEINALRKAGGEAEGATMYVTLEPCNHTGKTPPCSHAVARSGIKKVVIGMKDPNPLVAGSGAKYLADHSIEVVSGVMEKECRSINQPFIKFITTGKPLVALKAGVSLDGRLNYRKGTSGWITGAESLQKVHLLRDCYDAIMVGRGTAVIDDPSLTTRLADDSGRDPVRVVLDTHLSIQPEAKLLNLQSKAETLIFHGKNTEAERREALQRRGAKLFEVSDADGLLDLDQVLECLGKNEITSVLVEGGGRVFSGFLRKRLADKAYLFHAPLFAGSDGDELTPRFPVGTREDAIVLADVNYTRLGDDMLVEGNIAYPL
ncbi:bifunctional diaminohydroxyphosphoribosylaminopyrimidine deaminase/5-amino-6-(5-phosphoribosylamino)uracil reductase RibD [Desulfopila inferna]|uniref:bifunctional diaminohydroxyphosphoribosylaminopyrimidine deaminase/5-amino-6-(5-phosphoribosylamino)uracil reductase RibD n=1 Tax=Desulfopila inferna TaxID=468528 RepID=UPI001F0574D3|nr:bifunctional diaminohydroxyphosphoribosylaminopyrimidine deaminase/5-amino-6-(5-phosphoribosylamino)uracil reductase RibD [Desulfopila inferna]